MQDLEHWIWLSCLEISPRAKSALLSAFGDASGVFAASYASAAKVKGVSPKEAELLKNHDLSTTEHALARCDKQQITPVLFCDEAYPERLRHIYAPPVVLYVLGQLPPVDALPVISVIGTRHASAYGLKMGTEIAWQIAACGGTVVSLLTAGIDEAAARGALIAGKPCIGVLGTTIDRCSSGIKDRLLENGAILSEYPPDMPQRRHFFRERNRIASGISVGVVVIEAPEKSGTRLFVTEAAEQGKDVFALPGNADAENAAGTLALLKEGATLVTSGKDVMAEYSRLFPEVVVLKDSADLRMPSGSPILPDDREPAKQQRAAESEPKKTEASASDQKRLAGLSEDQLAIVAAIDSTSVHIDDIIERTGLSTGKVLAQLTLLEIKGIVRREIGKRFSLK